MENNYTWQEEIYEQLFGEGKYQQKRKLKKLLCITVILAVIALILWIESAAEALFVVAVILLMWGWKMVKGIVYKAAAFFSWCNDGVIMFLGVLLWLAFGLIFGALTLVVGIVRFIQLQNE